MANANAAELIASIPECVSGCFQNGVAATGCDVDDYDCYCYANNHQTIVDTMYVCLDNRERKLDVECTDDEMFQMENRYWMVCKEYWEPTGTAIEPASATITPTESTSTKTTSSKTTSTLASSLLTLVTSASSLEPSSINEEASRNTDTASSQETDASGLSVGAQAGIGIGAGLAVILLIASMFLWIRERNKRRRLEEKLVEAKETALVRGMAYMNEKGEIYEMEGDRPYVEELRGDMRTPELSGISHLKPIKQKPGSLRSLSTATSVSSDFPSPRLLSPTTALRPPGRGPRMMSTEAGPTGRPSRVSSEDESASSGERRGST